MTTSTDLSQGDRYAKALARIQASNAVTTTDKSGWRSKVFRMLAPIEALTRVSAMSRAGTLLRWMLPLLLVAPVIGYYLGLRSVVFGMLMPASGLLSALFWVVKALQKSPWVEITPGSHAAAELARAGSASPEATQLYTLLTQLRSTHYHADLFALQAFNRTHEQEADR